MRPVAAHGRFRLGLGDRWRIIVWLAQQTDPAMKLRAVSNCYCVIEKRQSIFFRRYQPTIFVQCYNTFDLRSSLLQVRYDCLPGLLRDWPVFFRFRHYE
jgi:hypothetical protein